MKTSMLALVLAMVAEILDYLVSGDVTFNVVNNGGCNAVVSGMFFN
jgi:hypothetical protein